jgi:chemotaxis protein methyltransferase CheR
MTGQVVIPSAQRDDALSPEDFQRIASVLRRETGIELSEAKLPLVQSRLLRRLRALRLPDYGSYCRMVEADEAGDERLQMMSVLTTNVTGFFREDHHFRALLKDRIPDLISRLRMGGSVRIWSAGCSSGEEPYSLALTFLEAMPDISKYDFRLLATDIDPAILKIAVAGRYPDNALTGVPDDLRARYFSEAGDGISVVEPEIRNLVTFRRLNLIEPWPLTRAFDVIMCRNVVIYFGDDTKAEIWSRMVRQLQPDGWLITGHSERLNGSASDEMQLVATTTYRPVDGPGVSRGLV